MKSEIFDYIWESAVIPSVNKFSALCLQIDADGRYGFSVRKLDSLSYKVRNDYELIRYRLKNQYYKAKGREDDENLIDTHKIAACLSYSLIVNKPFTFIVEKKMPMEIFLSNYKVAYFSSLGLIYITLVAEYGINGYNDYADRLVRYGKLFEPPVSRGHDSYNDGRVYAMAQNDIYGNTFDILGYADMMYWIEMYTRQKVEERVDIVDLDRTKEV